jgi:hypothetical protein
MIIDSPWDYSLDHDLPESSVTGDRNHLRIRARIPESPVRPRPDQRSAPGVGLRRRKSCPFGRRRPTAGRRPPRRLKSAFQGACAPSVGLRRRKRLSLRSAQANRRPKAFTPIEIGLQRRCTPGVGLRRRKRPPPGRRRPTAGRRPPRRLKSAFRGACAPGVGLRQRKRPPPGRRRPTIGRRPSQAEFIRHPPRQASASANAKDPLPVGAGRPPAEGLHAD